MQSIKNGSAATRNDPIWHRLRVELIWYLLLGGVWLSSIIISIRDLWNTPDGFSIFIYGIYLLALIKMAVDRFRWPSYWRRIGQRRDEALQGAQIPASPFQPVSYEKRLPIPMTFSLGLNKITLIMGGICAVLAVVSWIGLAIILLEQLDIDGNGLFILIIVMSIVLSIILILGVFYYFAFWRYRMQRIEITEEGIKAYYMQQERFLRWDEIRVFAGYGAQGTGKSSQIQTYEVANEQMVVRWSQLPIFNMFFSVQSSLDGKDDWNWLVGRLSTYVAERTGLALLDLGDKAAKRSASQPSLRTPALYSASQTPVPHQEPKVVATTPEPEATPIAQDDTLVQRLQWHGNIGNTFMGLGALGIIFIALGVLSLLPWTNHYLTFLSGDLGNFLLFIGIILLVLTLLISIIVLTAQKYWSRIEKLRLRAFSQLRPLAEHTQSVAAPASLPQPTSIRMRPNRILMFLLPLFVTFAFAFIFFYLLSHQKNILSSALISLALALFSSLIQIPTINKSSEQRIEVTEDGIATHISTIYSYVRWEDVLLFSSYRTKALFNSTSRAVTYELAGEKTVVRIMGAAKNWKFFVSEPKMSRAEFERWHEQLAGYIERRTDLPLINLDDLD